MLQGDRKTVNIQTIGPKTFAAMPAGLVFRSARCGAETEDVYAPRAEAFDIDSIYLNPAPVCRAGPAGWGASRVTAALLTGLTSGLVACSYHLG